MRIILLIVCLAVGETISARLERSAGGKRISIKEASFFVSIKFDDIHKCGGALISERHVITAAVCVVDHLNRVDFRNVVVTGTNERNRKGTAHEVVFISPLRENLDIDPRYDAAVLELRSSVTMSLEGYLTALPIGRLIFYVSTKFYAFESAADPTLNTRLQELPVIPHTIDDQNGNDGPVVGQRSSKIFEVGFADSQSSYSDDVGGPLVYNGTLIGIALPGYSHFGNNRNFVWVYKLRNYIKQAVPDVKISQ